MGDDPDLVRLRSLEQKLAKAQKKPVEQATTTGASFSQGELAWRMVIELVVGVCLGLAIGYGLDVLFGTMPIFLVIFVLFGFAAGVRTMMRTANQMTAQAVSKQAVSKQMGAKAPPTDEGG
ncbi:MAG: AtpZ/AtpI family protein [Paracoccaceae bacterium]